MSNPSISLPIVISLLSTTGRLGATITSAGSAPPVTAAGVVYSLTAINAAPAISGTGVTQVPWASPAVSAFDVPISGLTASSSYTFAAYATSSAGTAYTAFSLFDTPALPSFTTSTTTLTDTGETIYLYLQNRSRPIQIDKVLTITAIGQPYYSGTYRDLFDGLGPTSASNTGRTGFVTLELGSGTGFPPTAATQTSVSDEVAHEPQRQGVWIEGGLLFSTVNGLQYPFLWKDIIGPTNALLTDGPTDVLS